MEICFVVFCSIFIRQRQCLLLIIYNLEVELGLKKMKKEFAKFGTKTPKKLQMTNTTFSFIANLIMILKSMTI